MPHIVFDKKIDLESFSQEFEEIILKKPFLIKLLDVFIDRKNKTHFVLQEKNSQEFYMQQYYGNDVS